MVNPVADLVAVPVDALRVANLWRQICYEIIQAVGRAARIVRRVKWPKDAAGRHSPLKSLREN